MKLENEESAQAFWVQIIKNSKPSGTFYKS